MSFKRTAVVLLVLFSMLSLASCSKHVQDIQHPDTTTEYATGTDYAVLLEGDGWHLNENGVLFIETNDGAGNWASYSSEHYFNQKWKKEWRAEIVPIIQKIVINEGVTVLPEHTGLNLNNLSEIELPDTLEVIEKEAIFECPNLHEMYIPQHVSHIAGLPVTGNYETQWEFRISIDPQNSWYETTEGMLIEKETGTLLYAYSTAEEITVPSSVNTIIRYAFLNCFQLKTLYISSDCEIDAYAVASDVTVERK